MPTTSPYPTIADITLAAAGSDRQISLAHIGVPAVITFHDQNTALVVSDINEAVRNAYPLASSVVTANVADLRKLPKLLRSVAKRELKKMYAASAEHLPDDLNPEDYILILPDWDGAAHKAVGINDTSQNAAIVVLNGSGQIVGISQDDNLPETALALLKQIGQEK